MAALSDGVRDGRDSFAIGRRSAWRLNA